MIVLLGRVLRVRWFGALPLTLLTSNRLFGRWNMLTLRRIMWVRLVLVWILSLGVLLKRFRICGVSVLSVIPTWSLRLAVMLRW